MAFETKDKKKKFGSGFAAKKYDSFHPGEEEKEDPKAKAMGVMNASGKSEHEPEPEPEMNEPEQDSQETPEQTVEQHGPAEHVHIHSDHQNGHHVIVSHHKDGHMHHSTHPDAESAMNAAKTLGSGAEPEQDGPQQGETSGGAGTGIPRYA